ncbi:2oxoglutarate dehydrogenase [Seminavis robusta]|uniref:2oxoglutarate dehydrogenase n=1 Tax=Seminavis robusta TaxID=568900 RepID=A0A9N8D8Z7_9STRA|nr:2oxoglutarate dehydrogenase [Seminavis robusta]|eukprot:Sro35_g022570.1 2oxoglutarate dehydrogenase (556) ;mRNA; r:130995-132880
MEVELQAVREEKEIADDPLDNDTEKGKEDPDGEQEQPPKVAPFEIAGPTFERDPPKGFLLTSFDAFLVDWCFTILIGILVVSYWRGGWVIFDIVSCDQPGTAGMLNGESFCFLGLGTVEDYRHNTAVEALIAGYTLLISGLLLLSCGGWRPAKTFLQGTTTNLRLKRSLIRVVILLLLGGGTICLWRSIWYLLDYYVYPDDPYFSFQLTTALGAILCNCLCASASMLAPPAIFLMDGPSHLPPPVGVTIITSFRSIAFPAQVAKEKTAKDPIWLVTVDCFISYVLLPIGVVGFWRGLWGLLDTWLWGFTASQADVNWSILWSFLWGLACLFVGSEDMVRHFSPEKVLNSEVAVRVANMVFGRTVNMILAFGAVNYWRAVWLFWDEFLGNTHLWSAILSHLLGISGLLCLGCLSCITAPPSTLGVDAIAHPDCADEPLFHTTPVPSEVLYFLSIARRPESVLTKSVKGPDGNAISDPSLICDPKNQASMSQDILQPVSNLLVREDHLFSEQGRSTRFTEQTSSMVQSATRSESSSVLRLSDRHLINRRSNQFFRSR